MATGLQKGSAGPTPCLVGQGSLLEAAALLTPSPPAGSWDHSKQRPREQHSPGGDTALIPVSAGETGTCALRQELSLQTQNQVRPPLT